MFRDFYFSLFSFHLKHFYAAGTAVAVARINYGDSVRPSLYPSGVSRPGTGPSPGEIETPALHHIIA